MTFSPEDMRGYTGLDNTLGIELLEASPNYVVAILEVTPKLHQPFGYLHGGASVALAETVASVGATLRAPDGYVAFGQEINANHLRPKKSGLLRATGTPLFSGRSSQVWEVKIEDEHGRLICVSRCTLALVRLADQEGKATIAP